MKQATITPVKTFDIVVDDIASDKSISHRCAMFAMLADGVSVIRNYLRAGDTLHTLNIVKHLGATVEDDGKVIKISSSGIKESKEILDCGNSGTGMRLFCGLLSSADGHFILTGDEYLNARPMKRVTAPLIELGAKIDGRANGDLAPLSIRGSSLRAFTYESKIASAQVKSAMILAALRADGECKFSEPELSRDHTERMLRGMGADIKTDGLLTTINPLKKLLKPLDITVPADPSSAFFLAVAAAITPNAKVTLKDLTLNPTRIEAFEALKKMGAKVEYIKKEDKYEPIGDIVVEYNKLEAIVVEDNISWLIDELPVLSIAFACANGKSLIKNAKELRVKECDRITAMVEGLKSCGIEVNEFEDGYSVVGGELKSSRVSSFGDHRIAMSFLVAGLKSGMVVDDIECIDASFPNFIDILQKITSVEIV
ncbi:MAG: 3-phosphoshikimate 1-carboxyvinyltransferase [Sulfurimonas sp.]|jgi:3-phosphoshikimate 1-carboxyvinyltransferase|nr:3-phosphoshikimate 1-carboxyvinyltransferase [Sulfurimonadaceae bacterium]